MVNVLSLQLQGDGAIVLGMVGGFGVVDVHGRVRRQYGRRYESVEIYHLGQERVQ